MSKNKKNSKTNNAAPSANKVGRPKYQPVFPRASKWSFLDFAKANGVDIETLDKDNKRVMKGTKCTVLTLRKFLDRDMYAVNSKNKPDRTKPLRNSLVVLTDELGKSSSEKGLGRKSFMFQLRAKVAAPKTVKAKDVSKKTHDYEAKKAGLLAPTPAVTITPPPPVVEAAPVVEATTAPVEPVTPTPAPETAPVTPEPVTA